MSPRRVAFALVLVPLLLAGCGPQAAQQESIKLSCQAPDDKVEQAMVLMAQAVPSASFMPCVKTLPQGWMFSSFDARSGQAEMWFDSDRAGMRALHVTLVRSCTVRGTRAPSDEPLADLWIDIHELTRRVAGTRYYRFAGGCMMERFDYPVPGDTVLLADTTAMIDLAPRASVEEQLAKHGLHL